MLEVSARIRLPLEGSPFLIIPSTEKKEAENECWEAEIISYTFGTTSAGNQMNEIGRVLKMIASSKRWKKAGYEGYFETIAPAFNTAEIHVPAASTHRMFAEIFGEEKLVDITSILLDERARKTPYEIERLKRVNEIATIGLRAFQELVVPGMPGTEIGSGVEASIMQEGTGYRGANKVRAFAQVSTGPEETSNGYRPMEVTTTRRLRKSDIALLELAVVADGFWSDRTRVKIAGNPTQLQKDVYGIVKKAQEAAISKATSGVSAAAVDEAARKVIRDAGFGRKFMHITGHGVGFCYHEPVPIIGPSQGDLLEEGMAFSVEPGIYFPEMGGLRVEDDIVITKNSSEILAPFSKEL